MITITLVRLLVTGGAPYSKVDGKRVASLLQEGYRMPRPTHLDTKLYDVMRACWDEKAEARPSFTELREMMKEMGDEKEIHINLQDYDTKLYQNIEDMDA